ncbi:MAG TPA: hypothetical protein VGN76_09410 [Gemmatimonadales bacterium]|nr:hypothetical protein [Gemmatimonadales bacterium]
MGLSPLVLAVGIGIVAGLRSLTAPTAVSWAAHLGWLDLQDTRLGFMGSTLTVAILSLAALLEYVADLLPTTPRRTLPGPLVGRIVLGGFSGACLTVSAGQSWLMGAVAGAVGGLVGTFGGYEIRKRLVARLKVKDLFVAIPEDLVAILLAFLIVARH